MTIAIQELRDIGGNALVERFEKAVDELNAVLTLARKSMPEAEYYLSEGHTLNLMKGPHHAGNLAKEQRQNVVASANINGIDAGCW